MKNPNGYGGVSKLPGNRRKPYRVRLTAGWQYQTDGKPLQKYHTLGYYTSRRAALIALADYNKRPYDLNLQHITLGELYNQWYDKQPSAFHVPHAAVLRQPGKNVLILPTNQSKK